RGVQDAQRPDVVEHAGVLREQVDRQQRGHQRQHLGGQEEEQDVGPLLHRPDGQRVGGGQREQQGQQGGDQRGGHGVDQRRPGAGTAGETEELAVAVQGQRGRHGRRVGRRVGLRVQGGQHHPQEGRDEDETGQPGGDARGGPPDPAGRPALPRGGGGDGGHQRDTSSRNSDDTTRSAKVA